MQRILPLLLAVLTLCGCGKIENEPCISATQVIDEVTLFQLEAMRIVATPITGDAFSLTAKVSGVSLFESQRFGAGFAYRTETAFGVPENAFVGLDDVVNWTAHSENEHNHEWTSEALGGCRIHMAEAGEGTQVIRFPGGLIVELVWIEQ